MTTTMTQDQTDAARREARRVLITENCVQWLKEYNATAKPNRQFAGDDHWLGDVFIDRCLAMNLDPKTEQVTAYPTSGKLIFIPSLQSLRARARSTGEYGGCQLSTYVRSDKAVMVKVEVARIRGGVPALFSAEGNVAQWNAQVGSGPMSMWKTNPENQCQNAMERRALYMAFPEVLQDFEAEDYQTEDAPRATEAPAQTRPPVTQTDVASAAREALQAARRQPPPQEPTTAPETQAPAATPVTAPATKPQAAQVPATVEEYFAAWEAAGYTRKDVRSITDRIYGCRPEDLPVDKIQKSASVHIAAGLATEAEWMEMEFARETWMQKTGGTATQWIALVGFSYTPKFLKHEHLSIVTERATAALKAAA